MRLEHKERAAEAARNIGRLVAATAAIVVVAAVTAAEAVAAATEKNYDDYDPDPLAAVVVASKHDFLLLF